MKLVTSTPVTSEGTSKGSVKSEKESPVPGHMNMSVSQKINH